MAGFGLVNVEVTVNGIIESAVPLCLLARCPETGLSVERIFGIICAQ